VAYGGEFYFLENADNGSFGERVWIKGCLDYESLICPPFNGPGIEDNLIQPCPNECPCPGDVNGDGLRNALDVGPFVHCLLEDGPDADCACADIDGNGLSLQDVDLFVAVLLGGAPCPTDGACCLDIDDGPLAYDTCVVVSPDECQWPAGVFEGPGTTCTLEACCLPDGYCQDTDPECCIASGGMPQGPGSSCANTICWPADLGACCNLEADVTCHMSTQTMCDEFGGDFLGEGTECLDHTACCLSDGSCLFIDRVCCEAIGGTAGEVGGMCLGQGACCFDIDDGPLAYDTCQALDLACCEVQGGLFQGFGTACEMEACCLPGGYCQDTDRECCLASGGEPRGPGSTCGTTTCPS
jgi:hypothetical protein